MKKNCKTSDIMSKAIVLVALFLGTATLSSAQTDDSGVTVGDVSNSQCSSRTRSESVIGHPTLKLTRSESGLQGELINHEVNCAYGNVKVICKEDGERLNIFVDEGTGDILADCICQINVYFTIFNALKDEYSLSVNGRNAGTASFKEHSVVEIDLETLEQAHEEGFEYPLKAQNFWPYEITEYIQPDYDRNQSLKFYYMGEKWLSCVFSNYVLPEEYTYLDVQAESDENDSLVVNILTDGIPDKDCKRVGHLFFDIINAMKDAYHLRLNHTVLAGSENERTFCLYEGDITVPEYAYEEVVQINDHNDYQALLSSISHNQLTDDGSGVPYYDLQGRRIAEPQKKGVYIRNGKKVIK